MYHRTVNLEHDLTLKKVITDALSSRSPIQWREILPAEQQDQQLGFVIQSNGKERVLKLTEIAETVGQALTDLLLVQQATWQAIDSDHNRSLVANVTASVAQTLIPRSDNGSPSLAATPVDQLLRLSVNDLYLLIEGALLEQDAYDVAKALAFRHSYQQHGTIDLDASPQGMPVRLIRRNRNVVSWSETKIESAVRKAFLSIRENPEPSLAVAKAVTERVRNSGLAFVHIEDVQDMVEEELGRLGQLKVMRAYMAYRIERARYRSLEVEPQDDARQDTLLVVTDSNQNSIFWDGSELKKRIAFASIGLDLCLNENEIERELMRSIGNEISATDLQSTIILNSRTLIEKDADFAKFAGRILLSYIYEEVLDWDIQRDGIEHLKSAHKAAFRKYLSHSIAIKRLHPSLLEKFQIDVLADALDPTADLDFDYLGIQTLYDRYLIIDKTSGRPRRLETPQFFWMRVSMGLFREENDDREAWTIRLYNLYKSRRFCSSTPTLFNSGTLHSQLSSCYLYKVDDSIESIMYRGIAENAFLSKWAGGLGGSWTAVRGTGSYIQGTNGESQGIIPFLKVHNDQLVAVNQGGKRRGSGCAYLETWHNDYLDFIELRKNTGDDRRRTHDMNTASWIPDLFMKRVNARADWTFFRSNETPDLHELYGKAFEERYLHYEALAAEKKIWSSSMPALELWKAMLKMIFETGHPWFTFKDPCNVRSPQDHCGVIHSSNLCTEITLNTSDEETAVCNLGSVVLDTHLDEQGELDLEMLNETITVAIRALDNVIDINFYPTQAALTANSRHRPIGLGVMGLHQALFRRNVSFDSPEAVEFNDEFMEAIAYFAYSASAELAAERGKYSSYAGSKWDRGILPQDTIDLLEQERGVPITTPRGGKMDWTPVREKIAKHGMRNSNVLAIAPTATISNIVGTSPCIEPNYTNLYVKNNLSGDFIMLNCELVRELKKANLWNENMLNELKYSNGNIKDIYAIPPALKAKYKTVFDIDYTAIIDAAERRQKWIDQSQSLNLFLDKPDLKTLSHMYKQAWSSGLKTTYYLRSLQASDIEKSTLKTKKELHGHIAAAASANTIEEAAPAAPEIKACALDAMLNGEVCESCQ